MMALVHKFESASLGKAPFKLVGVTEERYQACPGAPVQPGGSCDYCGHAIVVHCHIESADGKRFKVGSDCVKKIGDKGLYDPIKRQISEMKRRARWEKDQQRIAAGRKLLENPKLRMHLSSIPHPNSWRAEQGDSLLNWAEWMFVHAGNSGMIGVCRRLETIMKEL